MVRFQGQISVSRPMISSDVVQATMAIITMPPITSAVSDIFIPWTMIKPSPDREATSSAASTQVQALDKDI